MDSPAELMSVFDVKLRIPEELALKLSIDQRVRFAGTIEKAERMLGACTIRLEEITSFGVIG